MANTPAAPLQKWSYWRVTAEDDNGKLYCQFIASDDTDAHAHKIFRSLSRLAITSCKIDYVECTQTQFDEIFPEDYSSNN